jgi:hypothetical protein
MIGAQTLPDFVKDLEPMGRRDKLSRRQMKIAGLGMLKETLGRVCTMSQRKTTRR